MLDSDTLLALEEFTCTQLIHGSLTSILGSLGREALELQLERFFTVWAWTWNIEDGHDLGTYLGALHEWVGPFLKLTSWLLRHTVTSPLSDSGPHTGCPFFSYT